MEAYRHITWQYGSVRTCVCVRVSVCVRACVRVCAHVCGHVITEIKVPFQDNVICVYHLYLIYVLKPVKFCHVELFICLYVHKWWHRVERLIRTLKE